MVSSRRQLHLLLIDPQNDFCDLPQSHWPPGQEPGRSLAPALPVAGAHADMLRVAHLIEAGGAGLAWISVTLDSHQRLDIAHPTFWQRGDGSAVTPFTQIEAGQVRAGQFLPRDPDGLERTLAYLDALEQAGRYRLMVWPVHCEIGTWGGQMHAEVEAACHAWETRHAKQVTRLRKGSNPWTEHYSAVQAEVPDPQDPATQLNRPFLHHLAQADVVYIAGEAGSHCVRATTEHIAQFFDADARARLVLVTDCMSPVAGFEQAYRDFLAAMEAMGVRLAVSDQVLAELQANAG